MPRVTRRGRHDSRPMQAYDDTTHTSLQVMYSAIAVHVCEMCGWHITPGMTYGKVLYTEEVERGAWTFRGQRFPTPHKFHWGHIPERAQGMIELFDIQIEDMWWMKSIAHAGREL